jgi:hypothetical protein
MKKILLAISIILLPFFCNAENIESKNFVKSELKIVATVEIYDATVTSQDDHSVIIDFDLYNDKGAQANIKYAVRLLNIDKDGNAVTVHQKNYDEVVNLSENDTLHKQITYDIPKYIEGTYYIGLVSENDKGLPLATAILIDNEISLKSNEKDYVEIVKDSCQIIVENKKYQSYFGVDIDPEENLMLDCKFINHFNQDTEVFPVLTTYRRTAFGEKVNEVVIDESFTFNKKESKNNSLLIKHPKQPQSYTTIISLQDKNGNLISNKASVHYVVRGSSATIQNVVFDKDYYNAKDIAKLSFLITGAADNFPGARQEQGTDLKNATLKLTINTLEGEKCAQKELPLNDKDLPFVDTEMQISNDCINPVLSVEVVDEDGLVLDDSSYFVMTKSNDEEIIETQKKQWNVYAGITIIAMIFLIIVLIYYTIKYHKITKSIIFLVIVGLSGFIFSNNVYGITVTGNLNFYNDNKPGDDTTIVATYGLEKSTYEIDDDINMTVSGINIATCKNLTADVWVISKIDSTPKYDFNISGPHNLTRQFSVESGTVLIGDETCGGTNKSDHSHANCTSESKIKKIGTAVYGSNGNHKAESIMFADSYLYGATGTTEYIINKDHTEFSVDDIKYSVRGCTAGCTYGGCNVTCGGGTKSGTCTRANCTRYSQKVTCNTQKCPVICGDYSSCSKYCGGGTKSRTCQQTYKSPYTQTINCNTHSCPSCGTKKNTCAIGSSTDTADTNTKFKWDCSVSQGNVIHCSTEKPACTTNACGTAHKHFFGTVPSGAKLCKSDSNPGVSGKGKPWTWKCTNFNCVGSATCEAKIHEAKCENLSGEVNHEPIQDKNTLCKGCTDKLCSVTKPKFNSTGTWNWTCTHKKNASPKTAKCEAQSCLAGDVLNVQSHIYLKENSEEQRATVNVNCNEKVCCEFANTNMFVDENGSETPTQKICTDSINGTIQVQNGTKLYAAKCYFDNNNDNTPDSPTNYVSKNPQVATMCTQRECNVQGTCQATPKQASSLDECSSTCNSNADCSSGKIIETRP